MTAFALGVAVLDILITHKADDRKVLVSYAAARSAIADMASAAAVVPRSAVAPRSTVVMERLTTTAVAGNGTVADHRRFHRTRHRVLE